jgi:hypothetical protein
MRKYCTMTMRISGMFLVMLFCALPGLAQDQKKPEAVPPAASLADPEVKKSAGAPVAPSLTSSDPKMFLP